VNKNNRILVMDDDADVLATFRYFLGASEPLSEAVSAIDALLGAVPATDEQPLRLADFEVTTADQGRLGVDLAAKAVAEECSFALAFIDMRMPPGWNGLVTAKKLREVDPNIYVVFVTAFADHTAADIYRELNHNVLLLKKPFNQEEIALMAATLCGSWNANNERRRSELRLHHALQQFMASKSQG